jgi:hypothetical protein
VYGCLFSLDFSVSRSLRALGFSFLNTRTQSIHGLFSFCMVNDRERRDKKNKRKKGKKEKTKEEKTNTQCSRGRSRSKYTSEEIAVGEGQTQGGPNATYTFREGLMSSMQSRLREPRFSCCRANKHQCLDCTSTTRSSSRLTWRPGPLGPVAARAPYWAWVLAIAMRACRVCTALLHLQDLQHSWILIATTSEK